jgi:hypothetical protein
MNCDEAREMLAGYADGELSHVENDAIAVHLEQCGRCRQIVHDQQRIQHVFDQYPVPAVADADWDEIGKRLRTELEGQGERVALKTQPRIEDLEPTPAEPLVALRRPPADQKPEAAEAEPASPPARPAREVPSPGPGPDRQAGRRPAPTMIVHRPGRGRARPGLRRWTAHLAGMAAAAAIILLSLAALWLDRGPPIEPEALARQGDVDILEFEYDADCCIVLRTGDANEVMAIWVEPEEPNG